MAERHSENLFKPVDECKMEQLSKIKRIPYAIFDFTTPKPQQKQQYFKSTDNNICGYPITRKYEYSTEHHLVRKNDRGMDK